MSRSRARALALLLAMSLVVIACNSSERPEPGRWQSDWNALTSVIPEPSELGDPPDQTLCQSTLAAIRDRSNGLLPSPTVMVDDLAGDWVSIAEKAFFDCPPAGQDIASFDQAYSELERLEESVETALDEGG